MKAPKEAKATLKTPSGTSQAKKVAASSATGAKNAAPGQPRPKSEDQAKTTKIAKEKSQKSSTPAKGLNISSTEIQLKQQQSPQVNLSSANLINSSSDKIRDSQPSHRTPSPSASSLSSLSMSTSLVSPSNDYLNSDTDSNLKYEPALISRPKLKQIKESELKKSLKTNADSPQQPKPNTPPFTSNKPNIAQSLGLGIGASLKGGFKIPHKTKPPGGQAARPPTPVPLSLSKKVPPVPLMSASKIQPLMSFNSTIQSSDLTPSSPSPSPQDELGARKKSDTAAPPDSPVSDNTLDSVKPKVIPLERNTAKSDRSGRGKQADKSGGCGSERDDVHDANLVGDHASFFRSTFSTRNITNGNEVLAMSALSGHKVVPYVPSPAARLTNSPGILEEDLVNGALTG
ncbi:hypothetical protein BpHYR1_008289 [Brachionus plicatilis]|uniref:Uncharacterized protein n=1 Tax=Brachionus plicatilis TaxID=10195 RepID=A0A3M7RZA7_BRAPC|nr:hypothetical protein BpHYR1_008289 [Brachionus plicatilis]